MQRIRAALQMMAALCLVLGSCPVASAQSTAPAFTTDPADQSTDPYPTISLPGGRVEAAYVPFTAAASGTPAPTYRWEVSTDGGATWGTQLIYQPTESPPVYKDTSTNTLQITGIPPWMNGYRYRAVATNSAGIATSRAAVLTVNGAPAIFDPSEQIVLPGDPAAFVVSAPTSIFQWQVSTDHADTWSNLSNSPPYSGVTTTTLAVANVTLAMHGYLYRAVATLSSGPATSRAGALSVNGVPAIVTQSPDQTVTAGQAAHFIGAAIGGGDVSVYNGARVVTYQWQVSTTAGVTWSNLSNTAPYSGATTETLTVSDVTPLLSGTRYRFVASNRYGSATSTARTLTVVGVPGDAPTFTAQPAGLTINQGQNAVFTVAADGTPAPAFQWYVSTNGGLNWSPLANTSPYGGATTTTLTVANVTLSMSGARYLAVATNSVGAASSSAATLTVPPTPPGQSTLPSGRFVIYSNLGPGGSFPTDNGWDIAGTNLGSINATPGATVSQKFAVTKDVTFTEALLPLVLDHGTNAISLKLTADSDGWPGETLEEIVATGLPVCLPRQQCTPLAALVTFTSVLHPTLTSGRSYWLVVGVPNVLTSDTYAGWVWNSVGDLSFDALNSVGSRVSNLILQNRNIEGGRLVGGFYYPGARRAAFQVNGRDGRADLLTQPTSQTIASGQTATLSVGASGEGLSYQWYVGASGTTSGPVNGATTSVFTTPALTSTTSYWVRVSNPAGAVDSNTATVETGTSPVITRQPTDQTVALVDRIAAFTVAATGSPAYQWYTSTDGGITWSPISEIAPYSGVTTTTLTVTNITLSMSGTRYRAVATNGVGAATSTGA